MLRPVLAAVLIVAPNLVTLPRRFARTTPLSAPSSVQVGMARDLLGICGAGTGLLHGPPLQTPHMYHARPTLVPTGAFESKQEVNCHAVTIFAEFLWMGKGQDGAFLQVRFCSPGPG